MVLTRLLPKETSEGKPTTRRHSDQESATAAAPGTLARSPPVVEDHPCSFRAGVSIDLDLHDPAAQRPGVDPELLTDPRKKPRRNTTQDPSSHPARAESRSPATLGGVPPRSQDGSRRTVGSRAVHPTGPDTVPATLTDRWARGTPDSATVSGEPAGNSPWEDIIRLATGFDVAIEVTTECECA